jgi:hypothetical protein
VSNSYTNITIRGPTQRELVSFLGEKRITAYVSETRESITVVYVPLVDEVTASDVSDRFGCVSLLVSNYDDARLTYRLYRLGTMIDEYESCPDYESRVPRRGARGGNPELLCRAFHVCPTPSALGSILYSHYDIESLRHGDLAAALAIPFSPLGLEDIRDKEGPDEILDSARLEETYTSVVDSARFGKPPLTGVVPRESAFVPSLRDLRRMTIRTVVALAARSARRAQWLLVTGRGPKASRKLVERLEDAIRVAEEFAAGAETNEAFRNRAALAAHKVEGFAIDVRYGPNWTGQLPGRLDAAGSAHNAAIAALNAAAATLYLDPIKQQEVLELAVQASFQAVLLGIVTEADWRIGLGRIAGDLNALGAPVDPGEQGPFGPLC